MWLEIQILIRSDIRKKHVWRKDKKCGQMRLEQMEMSCLVIRGEMTDKRPFKGPTR